MASQETHSWTLGGLIGAFIDLFLAYFLLCGSAFAFFVSKLVRFFGLCLPCPCKGSFGYRNSRFCVHRVLFEWPSRKICSIQVMAVKRFPFDLVRVKGHSCSANDKIVAERTPDNRVAELEDEASCSSCSGVRLPSLVDRENVYDAKGKRVMSMKRRSGIRRRRRGSYDCGKVSSAAPGDNLQPDVALTPCLPCDGSIIRYKTNASINPTSGKGASVVDAEDDQTGHDLDEKTCHSYEFNESMVNSPEQDKCSLSLEHYMSNAYDNVQIVGNEEDRIKMLENALEEEKAAYAALYLELEKERASAATAADETMAMISRLQEEKASMEMEMRQYQRMIEERFAYDEEEMDILQEILIRRERENHFLEKELEAYRKMDLKGSDQSYGKAKVQHDEWEQRPPISVETYEDRSTISFAKKDEISDVSSNYMVVQTCMDTEDGEELEKNTKHKVHSLFYDTEPDVLDVHVIDDNIEVLREEENEKLSSSSLSTVTDKLTNRYLEFGSLTVPSSEVLSNCPRTEKTENGNCVDGPTSQLSMFSNSRCKTLSYDSGSDSSSAVTNEKLKIGNEIEILGERLRMLKHGKEKLSFFAENGESEKGRLKLLEEIANHLQQIKQLRNTVRGASLPPSSSKVSLKKRRCQSVSLETCESS
ncbi:Myosin-binding protein 2 [Spatholobus suberectus]|nr:Myosin-binding protein 2 [Spatholobus suberectus]